MLFRRVPVRLEGSWGRTQRWSWGCEGPSRPARPWRLAADFRGQGTSTHEPDARKAQRPLPHTERRNRNPFIDTFSAYSLLANPRGHAEISTEHKPLRHGCVNYNGRLIRKVVVGDLNRRLPQQTALGSAVRAPGGEASADTRPADTTPARCVRDADPARPQAHGAAVAQGPGSSPAVLVPCGPASRH